MLESSAVIGLELFWKSTAVLVAACGAAWLLRQAAAALRHTVWTLAICGLLLLPVLEAVLPAWSLPAPTHAAISSPAPQGVVKVRPLPMPQNPVQPPLSLPLALGAVWMAGTLLCLVRWTRALRDVARIRRRATPVTGGAAGTLLRELPGSPVELLISDREISPMTAGIWRPAILLPVGASNWPLERLRVVLLHELAHISRRDCLTQAVAEFACSIYWPQPLAWVARWRIRVEQERASDDLVLRAGSTASDYAANLLALAGSHQSRELFPAAAGMARCSRLEDRVRAILNPHLDRRAVSRPAALAGCLIAACLVVPVSAMRPQAGNARTVSGTVYDAEKARVPEAKVILANADTGEKLTASTDQVGDFSFGPLGDGSYRLEVNARGFVPAVRMLKVEGTHRLRLDITLELGQVMETMVVRGKGSAAPAPAPPRRIRVGGNVTPAKVVHQVRPEYPEAVRSRGIQGDVVVRTVILMDGTLSPPAVLSSPDPLLSQAAIDALRQWRYAPALLNGKPLEAVTTITINFELEP